MLIAACCQLARRGISISRELPHLVSFLLFSTLSDLEQAFSLPFLRSPRFLQLLIACCPQLRQKIILRST
jgi:hypothetical protein